MEIRITRNEYIIIILRIYFLVLKILNSYTYVQRRYYPTRIIFYNIKFKKKKKLEKQNINKKALSRQYKNNKD